MPLTLTDQKPALGLVAIGSSGRWKIAIDQSTTGRERWFAQVEGPSIYLSFEIPALNVIDDVLEVLSGAQHQRRGRGANSTQNGTFAMIGNKTTQVSLFRDDEFTDRYFLVVESKGATVVRFTVAGEDLTHLTAALRQVKKDLTPA